MEKSKTKEVILHEIKLEKNSHAITSSAYALTDDAITKAMQIFADQETAKLKEQIDFLNKANLFLMDELKEAKELLYKWKHGNDLTITERTDNFLKKTK